MCENTRHDVTTRMALVPRTLEARGLDATPIIQSKLRKVGTPSALAASAILDTILLEEVGAMLPSETAGTTGCASATNWTP